MKIKKSFQIVALFTVFFLSSFAAFAQNNTSECVIVMEIGGKKYCISNLNYGSSYSAPVTATEADKNATPSTEVYYYLSVTMHKNHVTQELADWATQTPFKKQQGVIKVYNNVSQSKVLKEIKIEDVVITNYSDNDDAGQNTEYASTSLSFNCKKLTLKLSK